MPDLLKSISEFGSAANQPNKNIDRLSIQLRLNGFSFCVSNPSDSSISYFNELKITDKSNHNNKWQNTINLFEDWLIKSKYKPDFYKEVKILIDTPNYTFLPSSFLQNNTLDDQINFNQNLDFSFKVFREKLINSGQELLYPIHLGLNTIFEDYFPETIIKHVTSELREAALGFNTKSSKYVFAYVSQRDLHLLVFNDQKLLFQNSYSYTSKEDFIYFVLLIYNSQKINPENDYLYLIGDINPSSALYNICYQYIRNIELINHIPTLKLDAGFDTFPVHQYFIQIHSAL